MVLVVQGRRSLPRPDVSCLTVAVGVCNTLRQRWLVEKLTELGVGGFWPLRCERSTVLPGSSTAAKWRRWAIEAAKQSRQAWLPQVAEPQDFANVVAAASAFGSAFLASAQVSAQPILTVLSQLDRPPQRLLAVVGPEGGLTDAEQTAALAGGFKPVRVGPTTLRVETAAIALAATVAAWADGGRS
jgi:16S rRNA (uracil1498-N3)-methyltransferase